jgi:hypothetical protein
VLPDFIKLLSDDALEWQVMRALRGLGQRGLDPAAAIAMVIEANGRYWSWTLAGEWCERLAARAKKKGAIGADLDRYIPMLVTRLRDDEGSGSGATDGILQVLKHIGRRRESARLIAGELKTQGAAGGAAGKRLAALMKKRS